MIISSPSPTHRQATIDAVDALCIKLGVPVVDFKPGTSSLKLNAISRPVVRTPSPMAMSLAADSLSDLAARHLRAVAPPRAQNAMRGMSSRQIGRMALSRRALRVAGVPLPNTNTITLGTASASDFPALFADALGKAVLVHFAESRRTWRSWCAENNTVIDFKQQKRPRVEDAPQLLELEPGESIEFGLLTEAASEVFAIGTYARGLKFTREALANDDTQALADATRLLGESAARLEERLAYAQLTANALMADGGALFSTGHANTTTGALTAATLGAAIAKLSSRTSPDGETLDIQPALLLVPSELQVTASTLVAEAGMTGIIKVIASGHLSSNSSTQWFLLTDPRRMAAVEVARLMGGTEPRIEAKSDFDSDTYLIKCVHDVAAAAVDYRAVVRSSGT